jgi:hypothetical protein
MKNSRDYFNEFIEDFNKCSDEEIIKSFNGQVGNHGWGTARSGYLASLHQQFDQRNFDYSAIGSSVRLSFKYKVKLDGKKVIIIPKSENDQKVKRSE